MTDEPVEIGARGPQRRKSAAGERRSSAGEAGDELMDAGGVDPLDLAFLELSDLGNAQRLCRRAADRLLYDPARGWLAWTGTHWDAERGARRARELAHEVAAGIRTEAAALEAQAERQIKDGQAAAAERARDRAEALFKWAVTSGNAGRTSALLEQSEPYLTVEREDLDRDALAITCLSGTLRLRPRAGDVVDLDHLGHEPRDRITKCAAAAYDPEADCPLWRAHLERCLPNPEVRSYLQRALGYAMTGEVSEQAFFLLLGSGQDGKTTTINIVRRVLGTYAATADVRSFLDGQRRSGADASPDMARLAGDVRLLSADEPPRGAKLNEGLIKSITGGGEVLARHLQKEFFGFTPKLKLFIEANNRPRISGGDIGIWRRVKLIPFNEYIPDHERDKTIEKRIVEDEASGVLNWLLEGSKLWLIEGLWEPEAMREAIADYRAASNPFGEWFAERCTPAEGEFELASDLFRDYESWCQAAGVEPISQTRFGRELGDRGVIRHRGTAGRIYRRGVRLVRDDLATKAEQGIGNYDA